MHGQRVDPSQFIGLFEHADEGIEVRLPGGVGIAGGFVAVEDKAVPTENRGMVTDGREGVGGVASPVLKVKPMDRSCWCPKRIPFPCWA